MIMDVESERAGSIKDRIRRVAELSELEIPRSKASWSFWEGEPFENKR
jgi:hypothetical protein